MTIEEIEARLDVGCATDDDMAYLLDRVRKLERAHLWFAKQGPSRFRARGQYPACAWCGVDVHKAHCEWVKARDLTL